METALYILIISLFVLNIIILGLFSRNIIKTLDNLYNSLAKDLQNMMIEVFEELKGGALANFQEHNPIKDALAQVIMNMVNTDTISSNVQVIDRDSEGKFTKK